MPKSHPKNYYKHHYCSKICAGKGQWKEKKKAPTYKKCLWCKKTFKILRYKYNQKFCSANCKKQYQKRNPPRKRLGFYKQCKLCGRKFYVKRTRIAHNPYCSRQCYHKAQRKGLVSTSIQFLQGNETFERRRLKGLMKRPNYPESMLLDWLKEYNFPYRYTGNGEFFIGRLNPDFVNINGQKKIIEIFGETFHRKQEEKLRKEKFKEFGFKTLVIWARELKDKNRVINKIKRFENDL